MRFGFSPLTFDLIINVIKKEGLEGLSKFRFSEVVEGVAVAGYKHCELILDMFQIFPIPVRVEEIEKLKQLKREHDITYSVHCPFFSVDLAGPNKFVREGSVRSLIDSYNSFKGLENDIDVFVLHPTDETVNEVLNYIMDSEIRPIAIELFVENSIQSIERFIEDTGIDKNKIAIENIAFPFDATIKIIKELNTRLCLDTAHLLGGLSGNHDLLEITEKYLDMTSEIHLQDYTLTENSDHGALGTEKNFPPEFLNIIHERDFKGPIVFELTREEAIMSIEYIKTHAPEINVPKIKNQPFY